MSDQVNIPFYKRLEPNESTFTIDIDKKYIVNHADRMFGFKTVTLVPDYYHQKAVESGVSSDSKLSTPVIHDIRVEVNTSPKIYKKIKYKPATQPLNVSALLKHINDYYYRNRIEGTILPTVILDWVHIDAIQMSHHEAYIYYLHNCELFYGEKFKIKKHATFLPQDIIDLRTYLNIFEYPKNPEVWSKIRIRINLASNAAVSFSDKTIPEALGFTKSQFPFWDENKFILINKKLDRKGILTAEQPPITTEKLYNKTTTYAFPGNQHIVSPIVHLTTTRGRERVFTHMLEDYNASLRRLRGKLNLYLHLDYDEESLQITPVAPQSEDMKIILIVPPKVSIQLGYGDVGRIPLDTKSGPVVGGVSLNNLASVSQVLAFDTGMTIVSLNDVASVTTHQFTNQFMALLEPCTGGYLATKKSVKWPKVLVSHLNSRLEFVISKFSETNEPIPLGWRSGGYIRGVLASI